MAKEKQYPQSTNKALVFLDLAITSFNSFPRKISRVSKFHSQIGYSTKKQDETPTTVFIKVRRCVGLGPSGTPAGSFPDGGNNAGARSRANSNCPRNIRCGRESSSIPCMGRGRFNLLIRT